MAKYGDFIKKKTDAECRELAIHYYNRARIAEQKIDYMEHRMKCNDEFMDKVYDWLRERPMKND